ncbi:MAG: Lar family restriction alleviation protein [Subdoligranulum sp.]
MKIKLKRCPFCGSTAGLYESYDGMYVVQCNYCSIGTIHIKKQTGRD